MSSTLYFGYDCNLERPDRFLSVILSQTWLRNQPCGSALVACLVAWEHADRLITQGDPLQTVSLASRLEILIREAIRRGNASQNSNDFFVACSEGEAAFACTIMYMHVVRAEMILMWGQSSLRTINIMLQDFPDARAWHAVADFAASLVLPERMEPRIMMKLNHVRMPAATALAIASLRLQGDDYSASILFDQALEVDHATLAH